LTRQDSEAIAERGLWHGFNSAAIYIYIYRERETERVGEREG